MKKVRIFKSVILGMVLLIAISFVNPFNSVKTVAAAETTYVNGIPVFESEDDAVAFTRSCIKAKAGIYDIHFYSSKPILSNVVTQIIQEYKFGDSSYLMAYDIKTADCDLVDNVTPDGKECWEINFKIIITYVTPDLKNGLTVYTNTADKIYADVMDSLDFDGKSDYEKVKTIYDFICTNVAYDYECLAGHDMYKNLMYNDEYSFEKLYVGKMASEIVSTLGFYSWTGAMNRQLCVCAGYADLFRKMCSDVGIESYKVARRNHAWNVVKVDGEYYQVDATWDAVNIEYQYFLKSEDFWHGSPDDFELSETDYDGADNQPSLDYVGLLESIREKYGLTENVEWVDYYNNLRLAIVYTDNFDEKYEEQHKTVNGVNVGDSLSWVNPDLSALTELDVWYPETESWGSPGFNGGLWVNTKYQNSSDTPSTQMFQNLYIFVNDEYVTKEYCYPYVPMYSDAGCTNQIGYLSLRNQRLQYNALTDVPAEGATYQLKLVSINEAYQDFYGAIYVVPIVMQYDRVN